MGLGIVTKINASSFEKDLDLVDKNYDKLKSNVDNFRKKLTWDVIAEQHLDVYENILNNKKIKIPI
jgi:glycosyltransferase involved in cell wall biosynthesis